MHIVFLGDCRIDGDFRTSVCSIPDAMPGADYYVLNLETAVSDHGHEGPAKRHAIVAGCADLEAVIEAFEGRLVLGLENNHAGDAGSDAFHALCSYLQARGVPFAGGGQVADLSLGDGRRLGFAAAQSLPGPGLTTMNGTIEAEKVLEKLASFDVAAMYIHWGEEYVFFPSPDQRRLAQTLAGGGVDLLVGMHPHVVQGTEQIDASTIYYSLGNGAFSVPDTPACSRFGLALEVACGDVSLQVEEVPFSTGEKGSIEPRGQEETWQSMREALARFPSTPLQWHTEAAGPFFRNHMQSWGYLIRNHGVRQVARMVRAFARPTYLRMTLGRLAGLGRRTRNDEIQETIERAVANAGSDGPETRKEIP